MNEMNADLSRRRGFTFSHFGEQHDSILSTMFRCCLLLFVNRTCKQGQSSSTFAFFSRVYIFSRLRYHLMELEIQDETKRERKSLSLSGTFVQFVFFR